MIWPILVVLVGPRRLVPLAVAVVGPAAIVARFAGLNPWVLLARCDGFSDSEESWRQ